MDPDVKAWMDSLQLRHLKRDLVLKRDIAAGVVVAEIFSRYFPDDVVLNNFAVRDKIANWRRIMRLVEKHKMNIPQQLADDARTSENEGAIRFLRQLKEELKRFGAPIIPAGAALTQAGSGASGLDGVNPDVGGKETSVAGDGTKVKKPRKRKAPKGEDDDYVEPVDAPVEPPIAGAPTPGAAQITPFAADDEDENEEDRAEMDELLGDRAETQKIVEDVFSVLVSQLDEEQMSRYEAYRRSKLPKDAVKKSAVPRSDGDSEKNKYRISTPMTIIVGGMAKIFAGEIVEEENEYGQKTDAPLEPFFIQEALKRVLERQSFNMKM